MFELFQELSNLDTETQSEQMLLEKNNLFDPGLP